MSDQPAPDNHETIIASIFDLDSTMPFALFRKLKIAANLMSHLLGEHHQEHKTTAARMRILIQLTAGEKRDQSDGILPSELSRHLGVSRNTVSALLNGLEEQGLVERHLHPDDRRQFLIRLTPVGRDVVTANAPKFGAFVGGLFESLTEGEQEQLVHLLDKVIASMHQRAADLGLHPPEPSEDTHTQPNQVRIRVWKENPKTEA